MATQVLTPVPLSAKQKEQLWLLGPYIAIIAIGVGIALLVPHRGQTVQQITSTAADQNGGENWFESAAFWGSLATCIIAAFAFLQVRDFRRSTERQLRAYVHLASAKVINLDKMTGRQVVVVIKNFGQTPALGVHFRSFEHVREYPLRSALDDPLKTNLPTGVETLPPHRASIMRVPVGELTEWSERALRNGDHAVYFWGVVTYDDIFGKPHFTRIRLVCEGEAVATGAMHATEEGNECD